MRFLPNSIIYGTYKSVKGRTKRLARKSAKVVKVPQRPNALHKQRSVAELLAQAKQHA